MDRQAVRALLKPVLRAREVPGWPLVAEDWDRVAQVFLGRRYLALDPRRSDGAPVVLRDHADGSIQDEYPDFESFLRALPGEPCDEDRR